MYREEVLDLSSRNLQLSKDNAELSARLRGDQESVRLLQERLVTVSREQEEEGAAVSGHLFIYLFFFLRGWPNFLLSCCVAVAVATGAAPAGRGSAARTREAAAARGLDAGEATDGAGAQFAQGEGRPSGDTGL